MSGSARTTSYFLMHKDKKVLSFDFYGNIKIFDKKFLPYGLYIEEQDDVGTKTNNMLNIINWLSRRVITIDRKYRKEIYNFLNLAQNSDDRTRALFSISYHSLSLTDVYWVKDQNEIVSFSKINLYDNSLSNSFVDVFLRGKGFTLSKDDLDSRDIGTSGQCPKAWYRNKDKELFLYKDGKSSDVSNEIIASKIVEHFKIDFVKYTKAKYANKIVSKCKIISNKGYSLLNSFDLKIYCLNHDIDFYDYIDRIDGYSYYMLNIIDYLIGNNDRHPNNWGVLIDNKSNKVVKLYPLMDFNKAFNDYKDLKGAKCLTVDKNTCQLDAAVIAVKKVGLNLKLKIPSSVFEGNKSRETMFRKRLQKLRQVV